MNKNPLRSLTALLLGAAAGAVLGVLFAPRAGRDTRKQLKEWLDEKREAGSEAVAHFRERLPEQKQKLADAWRKGTEAIRRVRKNGETPVETEVEA